MCVGENAPQVAPTHFDKKIVKTYKKLKMPRLCSATKEPIKVVQIIFFFAKIGDLVVRDWFEVVEYLVVDVLLGNLFRDRFFRGMYSSAGEVLVLHSSPVSILARNNMTLQNYVGSKTWKDRTTETIRIARKYEISTQPRE